MDSVELSSSTPRPYLRQRKPRVHKPLKGYEVCIHTCMKKGCISPKTTTVLWNKEGHSCWKHGCSMRAHPSCRHPCPGTIYLGMETSKEVVREPTGEESLLVDSIPDDSGSSDTEYDDTGEDEPSIQTGATHSGNPEFQPLEVVFVPDPNLELRSKSAAINDLSFVVQTINKSDYTSMKHLEGSIHVITTMGKGSKKKNKELPSHKVAMQEWASTDGATFYSDT